MMASEEKSRKLLHIANNVDMAAMAFLREGRERVSIDFVVTFYGDYGVVIDIVPEKCIVKVTVYENEQSRVVYERRLSC